MAFSYGFLIQRMGIESMMLQNSPRSLMELLKMASTWISETITMLQQMEPRCQYL